MVFYFTQLRNAMYSVLGSLIRSAPSIADGELARISTTLLGSLDESDPLAVQALWESVLLVISTFPVSLCLLVLTSQAHTMDLCCCFTEQT